jgi:hypothetical protein
VSLLAARGSCVITLLALVWAPSQRGLARFSAPDAVSELTRRTLLPHAVVLSHDLVAVFRALGGQAEDHARPDITFVPLSLLEHGWMVDQLARAHPELAPVLREYVVRGRLELSSLQSLAAERPVYLELDAHVSPELYPTLVSEGLLSRVLPDGATPAEERTSATSSVQRLRALYAQLRDQPGVPERIDTLLYFQALQLASRGDREAARELVALPPAESALARELAQLRNELAGSDRGPLDPRPFGQFEPATGDDDE